MGAHATLPKPFMIDDLIYIIEEAVPRDTDETKTERYLDLDLDPD